MTSNLRALEVSTDDEHPEASTLRSAAMKSDDTVR